MLHHIRKLFSTLSLLLALAIGALWIRSYWYLDELISNHVAEAPNKRYCINRLEVASATGGLLVQHNVITIDETNLDFLYLPDKLDFHRPGLRYRFEAARMPLSFYETPMKNLLAVGFAGFSHQYESGPFFNVYLLKHRVVTVPLWLFILLFSLPGLIHFRRNLKRRRRLRRGLCPTCGYDLRESKGACPECGATISSPVADP